MTHNDDDAAIDSSIRPHNFCRSTGNSSTTCKEQDTMEHNKQQHIAYEPPAVVYEAALEVRAGTPEGLSGALDVIEGK